MSARTKITNALVAKLKEIDGTGTYNTNLFGNVYNKHMFYDEINDFPAIYVVPSTESREYLPASFKWGYLNVILKIYVKNEEPGNDLENLLEDIETLIDANRQLVYDINTPGAETTEILISSIVTDEGLLAPYGVGEVSLQVRYQVLN